MPATEGKSIMSKVSETAVEQAETAEIERGLRELEMTLGLWHDEMDWYRHEDDVERIMRIDAEIDAVERTGDDEPAVETTEDTSMAKDYSDINGDIDGRGEQRVEFRPDGEGTDMAVNDDGRDDLLSDEEIQAIELTDEEVESIQDILAWLGYGRADVITVPSASALGRSDIERALRGELYVFFEPDSKIERRAFADMVHRVLLETRDSYRDAFRQYHSERRSNGRP
jgi:hypothetical protein